MSCNLNLQWEHHCWTFSLLFKEVYIYCCLWITIVTVEEDECRSIGSYLITFLPDVNRSYILYNNHIDASFFCVIEFFLEVVSSFWILTRALKYVPYPFWMALYMDTGVGAIRSCLTSNFKSNRSRWNMFQVGERESKLL